MDRNSFEQLQMDELQCKQQTWESMNHIKRQKTSQRVGSFQIDSFLFLWDHTPNLWLNTERTE